MQGLYKNVLLLCELEVCFDVASIPRRGERGGGGKRREDTGMVPISGVFCHDKWLTRSQHDPPSKPKCSQRAVGSRYCWQTSTPYQPFCLNTQAERTRRRCAAARERQRGLPWQIMSTQMSTADFHPLWLLQKHCLSPQLQTQVTVDPLCCCCCLRWMSCGVQQGFFGFWREEFIF